MVDSERLDAERRVLQVLCQGAPDGPLAGARTSLRGYRWRDPVHQAIFEIVLSLPPSPPDLVRDLLPSRLTRRGFPDFAVQELFQPHGLSEREVEGLIEFLQGVA